VPPRPPASVAQAADRSFAASAAALEQVLVAAYEVVVGLLPDDLVPVAEVHLGHHRAHAEALAELAGDDRPGDPDPAVMAALAPVLEDLSGVGASLRLAKDLEERIVATYVAALATLESPEAIALAASIAPVESAHAVVLGDLVDLGLDAGFPTGAFEPTDPSLGLAATPGAGP